MISLPIQSTIWIERYETLRRYILNGHQVLSSEPLSLVLWLTNGMAGWMRCWEKGAEVASPPMASAPSPRCPATPLWQEQLTVLLAQITTQHLRLSI